MASGDGASPSDGPPVSDKVAPSAPAVMQRASSTDHLPHVHYPPDLDTDIGPGHHAHVQVHAQVPGTHGFSRSDTELSRPAVVSPLGNRPSRRTNTFKTVADFEDFEIRRGWQPGSEPGFDPAKADGGHASVPLLWAPCEITVIDFSETKMDTNRLDNDTLVPFLKRSPASPDWAKCRWINVNGLSWDVIQVLGRNKKLHKLALEDVMNTRNRTKVDWYSSHAFIVLTLQKLVHLVEPQQADDSDEEMDIASVQSGMSRGTHRVSKRLRALFTRGRPSRDAERPVEKRTPYGSRGEEAEDTLLWRTLQRYHASPNEARTVFMERHSALSSRNLAVAAEQVSMFLTGDNCIISLFELSANEIEEPILRRLSTLDTVIRESCDASMLCQAIIDTIIDLAIPVSACYGDIVGDLELDVLTRPSIKTTKSLYVLISEVNKLLTFIHPIANLINALRDHRSQLPQEAALKELQDPSTGVIITPQAATYLLDVLDHCVLITEGLTNLKGSADGMIALIFNTISNYQNESMRQLAIVTLIFLPLSFLSGYFGQNFQPFDQLKYGINYFWEIAVPCVFGVIVFLMRGVIADYTRRLLQRRHISNFRRNRRRQHKKRK